MNIFSIEHLHSYPTLSIAKDLSCNLATRLGHCVRQSLPIGGHSPTASSCNAPSLAASWHYFRKHPFPFTDEEMRQACENHGLRLLRTPKLRPQHNAFCVAMCLEFLQKSCLYGPKNCLHITRDFKKGASRRASALQSLHAQLFAPKAQASSNLQHMILKLFYKEEPEPLALNGWELRLYLACESYLLQDSEAGIREHLFRALEDNYVAIDSSIYAAILDLESLLEMCKKNLEPYTSLRVSSKLVLGDLLGLTFSEVKQELLTHSEAAHQLSNMLEGQYLLCLPGHCVVFIHDANTWHLFDPSRGYSFYNSPEEAQNGLERGLKSRLKHTGQIITLRCAHP